MEPDDPPDIKVSLDLKYKMKRQQQLFHSKHGTPIKHQARYLKLPKWTLQNYVNRTKITSFSSKIRYL